MGPDNETFIDQLLMENSSTSSKLMAADDTDDGFADDYMAGISNGHCIQSNGVCHQLSFHQVCFTIYIN